jgi:Pyruvate/2-oxoacid:ferredoxin oxidoreductase delta subunit
MSEDIYRQLAKYLDKMPGGFPATEDGLELRILKHLFTVDQARLALHLTLIPEPVAVIARRAGLDRDETREMLEEMADKGLIYDIHKPGEPPLYMGYQFAVGIWEWQVNRLDPELVKDVDEYIARGIMDPQVWKENPQLRTIPIGESIPNPAEVLPYEHAEKIIQGHEKFAIADCICRKEKALEGEACDKPMETCLILGDGADYYERHGMGRPISKSEAFEILALSDKHGLVLQPANNKEAGNICFCCGDCCGVLRTIKQNPNPGTLISSPYRAIVDQDLCAACETCLERCQMEAIQVNGTAQIQEGRCIGCGLCVTTCDTGALSLERKPENEQPYIPKDTVENLMRLGRQRGVINTPNLVLMGLRSKIDRLLASQ